ncbi:hypothetical protein ACQP1K_17465 [Sphaerimonospora sp. CA-214678]|uniref:hypothetical protein n=1 Tax=Sphaerimonospora sp. CA-214678 TaxID=3240029 RepID=UPI003D94231C
MKPPLAVRLSMPPRHPALTTLPALAIGTAAVLSTLVLLTACSSAPTTVATPAATSSSSVTASTTSTPAPDKPLASPVRLSRLTWQDFHGVRLPQSEVDGPRRLDHDRAAGFARTRQGALLAALHIAVRANAQWGPSVFEPTITEQVTGPDADKLLEETRAQYEQSRREAGLPKGSALGVAYVAEEAYRWQSYTPDAATVDLVSAGPSPAGTTVRAVTRVQVVWRDGDWRVVAPLGGDWGNAAGPLTSLDGYTTFEG